MSTGKAGKNCVFRPLTCRYCSRRHFHDLQRYLSHIRNHEKFKRKRHAGRKEQLHLKKAVCSLQTAGNNHAEVCRETSRAEASQRLELEKRKVSMLAAFIRQNPDLAKYNTKESSVCFSDGIYFSASRNESQK